MLTSCAGDSTATAPNSSVDSSKSADKPATVLEPISIGGVTVSGVLGAEPVIEIEGPIASIDELLVADQFIGSGNSVLPTSTVLAHYVGYGLITGQKFDSSWLTGDPIAFGLNQVISGWTQGVPGMKIGGRRILVIPSELAYGARPRAGSGIEPNEPLVFVIDLYDFK